MAIYNSRLLSLAETYIKTCEFRSKLDKCPDTPRTRRLKERLDDLMSNNSRPKARKWWNQRPVVLTGLWKVEKDFLEHIEAWSDPISEFREIEQHLKDTEPLDPDGDWPLNNPYEITIVDMG